MPTSAEQLSRESDNTDYQLGVATCIRHYVEKGMDQGQAADICYKQAQDSTGRSYPSKKKQVSRTTGLPGEGI